MTTVEAGPLTGEVTSVEQLDAAPVGQVIRVASQALGRRDWTKTEDGQWEWSGHRAPGDAFIGGIFNHCVTWHDAIPDYEVGMVLVSGRYAYLIYEVEESRQAKVGVFRGGSEFIGLDRVPHDFVSNGRAAIGAMEGSAAALALLQHYVADVARRDAALAQTRATRDEFSERVRRAEIEARDLRVARGTVPEALVRDLHSYGSEVEDSQFDDLLARHNISRQVTCTVSVTVAGTSYVEVNGEQAGIALGFPSRYITSVEDSVTVHWRKEFEITRQTTDGVCVCDEVTDEDDDVTGQIPSNYDTFEIESVSCEFD